MICQFLIVDIIFCWYFNLTLGTVTYSKAGDTCPTSRIYCPDSADSIIILARWGPVQSISNNLSRRHNWQFLSGNSKTFSVTCTTPYCLYSNFVASRLMSDSTFSWDTMKKGHISMTFPWLVVIKIQEMSKCKEIKCTWLGFLVVEKQITRHYISSIFRFWYYALQVFVLYSCKSSFWPDSSGLICFHPHQYLTWS